MALLPAKVKTALAGRLKVVVIGLLLLAATPATSYAAPSYYGDIIMSPAQITVSPGETFTLSLDINDPGVTYNSAQIAIALGDGLTLAGVDSSGSAFNVAGSQKTVAGKYATCAVIGRSSTVPITGNSHLANVEFHVTSTPDAATSHNGTSLEQDWTTSCGPSAAEESYIDLNGWQANQGGEGGNEVFVWLTTQTPYPTATASPGPGGLSYLPVHASGNTSASGSPQPSNSNSTPAGKAESASTNSPTTTPSPSTSSKLAAPVTKVLTQLAAVKKNGTGLWALAGFFLLALVLAAGIIYMRAKKASSKAD